MDDLAASTQSWAISANLARNWLLGGTVVVDTIDHGEAGIWEIYGVTGNKRAGADTRSG